MKTLEEYATEAFAALEDARDGDAARILEQATKDYPERPKIRHFLGVARARLGEHDAAKRAFEEALQLMGETHDDAWRVTLGELGRLLERMNDSRSALGCFERILAVSPDDEEALYNAGSMCQSSGAPEAARRFYERLLRLRPNDAEVAYNIAATLVEDRRFDDALAHFERLAAAVPQDEHLQEAIEHCLTKLGRDDEATRHRLYRMKLAVPEGGER